MSSIRYIKNLLIVLFIGLRISPAYSHEVGQEIIFHSPSRGEAVIINKVFRQDSNINWAMGLYHFDIRKNVFIAWVKLNDISEPALLASFSAIPFCGSAGCDLNIWKKTKSGWKEIFDGKGDAGEEGSDIRILSSRHNGFYDLTSLEEDHVLVYDGKAYR